MAVENIFLEQEDRLTIQFAEVFFFLMRKKRYGIDGCVHCCDPELLAAQVETIQWRKAMTNEGL